MRYQLTNEFQPIQEKCGILQNLHNDAVVEFATVREGEPKAGEGILIRSNEKIQFNLEENQVAYIRNIRPRCEPIPVVVTEVFKKPASGGNGAGAGAVFTTLFSGYAAPSKTATNAVLTLNEDMINYDFLIFKAKYANHGITNIAYVPYFTTFSPHAELGAGNYYCNINRLSNTTIGQNYWNVQGNWTGPNDGIYAIMGLKLR